MKVKGWPGYVRNGTFVIEKRIKTVKFHVSTRCTTLRAAMQQLERFEADPTRYRPQGDAAPDALVLDKPMIEAFHAWHGATATHHWARNVRSLLFDWANHFAGADLRELTLIDHLKPHLREKPAQRHHRAKAIKLLFKWLRTERGDITRQQDATLDLVIPTLPPAQRAAPKAVAWELVVSTARHLPVHVRDVLELLASTGWHVSEARRFAQAGTIRRRNASVVRFRSD